MGRDLTCSREVEGIIAYAESVLNFPFYVTSTYRPNALTITGKLSNHALRLAVDFIAAHGNGMPKPSIDSPELYTIYETFLPVAAYLRELIYCGPGVKFCVKRGKLVAPYACAIHHNHVHVAVDTGTYLPDYLAVHKDLAEIGDSVTATETNERTDMAPAITVPRIQGGYAVLQTRDGGVFNYDSPFFGSLVGIAPGPFVAFTWTISGKGYWILDSHGAVFAFGDATYHGGLNEGTLVEHFGNRIPIGLVPYPNGTYDIIGQDLSGDNTPFDSYHLPV